MVSPEGQGDGPDWVFIGGMMLAVLSTAAFAAAALYVFIVGPH